MRLHISRNLMQRIIAALALLPPVLFAVVEGGLWLSLLLLLAAAIMAYEWNTITRQKLRLLLTVLLASLSSIAITAGFLLSSVDKDQSSLIALVIVFGLAVSMLVAVIEAPKNPGGLCRPNSFRWALAGFPYVLLAVVSIAWLRSLDEHGLLLIWLFFIVWATDVGGYFAGKGIGGPKLAPRISPKKTWSGFLGGMVLAMIVSSIFSMIFSWGPIGPLAAAAAVLAMVSQVGDLFESYVKRRFGVKDSGGVIPGHGGILDRVDGLIFAAPVAAIIIAGMQVLGKPLI